MTHTVVSDVVCAANGAFNATIADRFEYFRMIEISADATLERLPASAIFKRSLNLNDNNTDSSFIPHTHPPYKY